MSEKPTPTRPFRGYSEEDVPLSSYAAIMGVFNLLFALALLAAKRSGRPLPERMELRDMLLLAAATHKLSWLVTNEVVTSPIRAPFTELREVESPTHVREEPRGGGLRRSLGELLTCHFCFGQWIAALLTYGLLFFPAATRLFASIFAILAITDHLHQLYQALVKRS